MKVNCWDYKKCTKRHCPVMTENRLDGMNGGTNAGRACWVVAGTFCGNDVHGSGKYAKKVGTCIECDFYREVKVEEGPDLVRPTELLKLLN